MILKARYVLPVDGPPIENGAVAVEGSKIVEVGPAHRVSGRPVEDFGDAVILPGFVNAHTHLELSDRPITLDAASDAGASAPDRAAQAATQRFVAWLAALLAARRARPPTRERIERAVRAGLEESLRAGVTAVGDITSMPGLTRPVESKAPITCVSFGEVIAIGKRRHLLTERLDAVTEGVVHLDALHPADGVDQAVDGAPVTAFPPQGGNWESHGAHQERDGALSLRLGISPHSPYTVEPDGLRACAERAQAIGARVCVHLAETEAEGRFTVSREGPLAEYLKAIGVWDDRIPCGGCDPVELLDRAGLLGPSTILAHANYVDREQIERIARSGASVAYCPRTHAAFGHPPHPFREMLAAGVNVCIGTDSLASNPSLSVLDELRLLYVGAAGASVSRRSVPADVLLAMGTINGARALGLDAWIGSIAAGNRADLVVVPLEGVEPEKGWEGVLESDAAPVAVCCALSGLLR